MNLAGAALALLVGVSLGLLGAGGSVLAVPIFVYVLGVAAKPAIAMSLGAVGATALIGAIPHVRAGRVSFRVAAVFGAAAMIGAFIGARLAAYIPGDVQLKLFALWLLASALLMLRNARRQSTGAAPADALVMPVLDARAAIVLAVLGLAVGVMTAIIGVGGGFLIVPALVLVARMPMRVAVGTSLVIIMLNALSGFAGYLGSVPIDWPLLASFAGIAAVGSVMGSVWSKHVLQARLKVIFAVMLIVVAMYVLYRTYYLDPLAR